MKKFIIILTSVIIVLGAALFGVFFYNTNPSEKYELESFSFKVPNGFKRTDYKEDYMYTFQCFDEDINIESVNLNCTPELLNEFISDTSEEKSVKLEKLKGYPYEGYCFTSEKTDSGEKEVTFRYALGTDTHFLFLDCSCSPLKAKIIKPAIEKIAKTAKYTSDFRLADKPDVYDYDLVSVNTGSKYECKEMTSVLKSDGIFCILERYVEADTSEKMLFPYLTINIFDDGSSPAERADEGYNKKLENEDKYTALTRDQKDMFGFKCEHFRYESKSDTIPDSKPVCRDYYYFSKDKYTYAISVIYHKDSDEADIKEMLDGITIK